MSLKFYLIRLIWLCVLPLVTLSAYLAIDRVRTLQAHRDQEAANLARNFATVLDRHIDARIAALQVLAASSDLDDPRRLKRFYQEAQAFRCNFDSHVVLADLSKQMIFSTRVPYGTPLPSLPQVQGHSSATTAAATGKPAVGDVFLGPISNEPLVSIAVPVIRDGRTRHLLLSVIETSKIQQRLDELAVPPGLSITVLDGKGDVIARRSPQEMHGSKGLDDAPGRFPVKALLSPWSVVLQVPRGIYQASNFAAAAALVASVIAATMVGVVGGGLASRRLARSVAALAETPLPPAVRPSIAEIETVRSLLAGAAEAREKAELTLHESEAKYRLTLDSMLEGCQIIGADWRYLYLNGAAEEHNRRPKAELLGRTVMECWPGITGTQVFAAEKSCMEKRTTHQLDNEFIFPDGHRGWFRLIIQPVTEGIAIFSEDITGRKLAELAVAERENRLRRAEELAHLGHWRFELDTGNITWSDEIYRIFGFSRGDGMVGQTMKEMTRYCHPDDLAYCVSSFDPSGQEGGSVFAYRIIRSGGEVRHVVSNGEVERDEHGEVVALFGTLLDTTELARKERELTEKNAELERFTYTVSHDLKSPLVTIRSFIGFLENDIAAVDREKIARDMLHIRTATDRMSQLLDELLVMSRVGRVVNPSVRVLFADLVKEVLELTSGSLAERGVAVQVAAGEAVVLYGDLSRLVEIWQNLIENAVNYMGEQPSPRIEIGLTIEQGAPVFFVTDNGMGIDQRYHGNIFGLFNKLDPKSKGTGIGLALVKRIVEMYQGRVWVESEGAGKGSTFRLTLPGALAGDERRTELDSQSVTT